MKMSLKYFQNLHSYQAQQQTAPFLEIKYASENTADVGHTLQANYTENQVTLEGVTAHLSKYNTWGWQSMVKTQNLCVLLKVNI